MVDRGTCSPALSISLLINTTCLYKVNHLKCENDKLWFYFFVGGCNFLEICHQCEVEKQKVTRPGSHCANSIHGFLYNPSKTPTCCFYMLVCILNKQAGIRFFLFHLDWAWLVFPPFFSLYTKLSQPPALMERCESCIHLLIQFLARWQTYWPKKSCYYFCFNHL